MVILTLCGLLVIPLWILAPTKPLLILGGFLMGVVVQGSWGVVPAHINELSPPEVRGFFPGFCYQIGTVVSSGSAYIEARFAETFSYSTALGVMAALVLLAAAMRHLYVRGTDNVLKRVFVQAAAFNIGLLLRKLSGWASRGKPRGGKMLYLHCSAPYWAGSLGAAGDSGADKLCPGVR